MDSTLQTGIRETEAVNWRQRFVIGLLLVQGIVGFEFLMSALTKIVRGGFPAGLAADLGDRVKGAAGWYRSFAESVVVPHATLFGNLIMYGELLVGVALIGSAVVWIVGWNRLSYGTQIVLLAVIIAASFAGLAMNVNYHIANGVANPWQLSTGVFDEAVDLNSILPFIEAVIIGVAIGLMVSLTRSRRRAAG